MKKNLIIFYPSFEYGGVTNVLKNLIKIKNKEQFKIHIISSDELLKNIRSSKKFIFYSVKKNITIPFFPDRYNTALNGMFLLFSLIIKLKTNIVIHSMQSNVAAIIISILKRKKIIIRNSENPIHSTLNSENYFFGIFTFFLKFLFYNFADGIISNSKGSAQSLKYFVFNKKKIKHIYNPYLNKINKKKFKKINYIINIARLTKQKDHKTLLEAFHIFSRQNKKYKLLILGHGNLEYKLKHQCKKLGILDKVIFKGWVKNTDTYLKKSKIFVLSSVYEGLGNVLIDAINFNTPCISTNCPSGPGEILLNGKGGYLTLVKSPLQLADKMTYSIKNYSESLKKNSFAKKSLDRFLISNQSKKYFDYLYKFN